MSKVSWLCLKHAACTQTTCSRGYGSRMEAAETGLAVSEAAMRTEHDKLHADLGRCACRLCF